MNKLLAHYNIKTLAFAFVLIFLSGTILAQPPRGKAEDREKIKQLKIAHLTMALDMTEAQAEKFWPVYNKYEKLRAEERKNRPAMDNIDKLSEVEAAQILDQMYRGMENQHNNKVSMHEELSQILSPNQMLAYYKAEHTFNRKLMERLKGPRSSGRDEDRPRGK